MKYAQITTIAGALLAAASLQGLTLEVQQMLDGQPLPSGYQQVDDGIEAAEVLNVSADPFVDYLIPNNSGSAGITAQKDGGQYITSSDVDTFGGANNGTDPDKWHVVFEWDDGTPLPFGTDFYGVTWGGWSADDVTTLTTRVDLATTDEVTVYHWFNDGWNYADGGHNVLSGHVLTVTQYNADGTQVATQSETIPSGGAEGMFGDHRKFCSSIITATATAAGDYLIITNEGGNVGYKGTAVALLGGGSATWNGYDVGPDGWVDTGAWMGMVNVTADPWIWSLDLSNYIYVPVDSGWVYIPN
jgi:hypothetical protein